MVAEPNAGGMARLLYVVGGAAIVSWGLWGADRGLTEWIWLLLGGIALVFGIIGYSPAHALFGKNDQKAG